MAKIISQLNITPDGFCGHTAVIADDELHDFSTELLKNAGAALFGRVTYQLMESYWPAAAKDRSLPRSIFEFAQAIDKVDKIVFSRTLESAAWAKTTIMRDLNKEAILELKQQSNRDILTGGPGIISQLTRFGLMDEYYFLVHPIITGKGKRLFETINLIDNQILELAGTRTFKSGVVLLHYNVIHKEK